METPCIVDDGSAEIDATLQRTFFSKRLGDRLNFSRDHFGAGRPVAEARRGKKQLTSLSVDTGDEPSRSRDPSPGIEKHASQSTSQAGCEGVGKPFFSCCHSFDFVTDISQALLSVAVVLWTWSSCWKAAAVVVANVRLCSTS